MTICRYISLIFISVAVFAPLSSYSIEKLYLVSGSYLAPYAFESAKGIISIYDPVNRVLTNQFESYGGGSTASALAYFENSGSMQILNRLWDDTLVIYNLDGTIFRTFNFSDNALKSNRVEKIHSNGSSEFLAFPNCNALLSANDNTLQILSGYRNGKIALFDVASGSQIKEFGTQFSPESYGIMSFTLFADGDTVYLVAASCDNTVCVYNFQTAEKLYTFSGFTNWVTSVAVFKDSTGFNIVAGAQDATIRCWNIGTQQLRYVINNKNFYSGTIDIGQKAWVYGLVLFKANDSQILISPIANNSDVVLFDAQTGAYVKTLPGNTSWVSDLRPYKNKQGKAMLVGASEDGFLRVWDVNAGVQIHNLCTAGDYGYSPRNICLYSQENNMMCAAALGGFYGPIMPGAVVTFNLETGAGLWCYQSETWMNGIASYMQKFEDKKFSAISHDSVIGGRIPMWNLDDIQVISV